MRKYYKLGTSDYEFVASHDHYAMLVKDKDGKPVKVINENGALQLSHFPYVVKREPITAERITEIFNSPDMYLRNTEGRSLAVMERDGDNTFFRGFVIFDKESDSAYRFKLTMSQHAKDVLAAAKEGVSFKYTRIEGKDPITH